MADLTDLQSAETVKIVGSDSTGVESAFIGAATYNGSSSIYSSLVQNEFVSINNSSVANLGSGAIFTGTSDSIIGYGSIDINFKSDQPVTISVQQSINNSNWDIVNTYTVVANIGDSRSISALASFTRILVTNNGGSTTTFLRLQTILSPIGSVQPRALGQNVAAVSSSVVIASDQTPIPTIDYKNRGVTGSSWGHVTSSAVGAVRATVYNEQITNARRSLVSSSASDTAAGTGARTVMITYYDSSLNGPFTETLTMNGTTAVNTVNTNICFIERMDVVTGGSSGGNNGIISLTVAVGGAGGSIGTIAVLDNQTFWAHHYVTTGKTTTIVNLNVGAAAGSAGLFYITVRNPQITNNVPKRFLETRIVSLTSFERPLIVGKSFTSPAQVTIFYIPDANGSTGYAEMEWADL